MKGKINPTFMQLPSVRTCPFCQTDAGQLEVEKPPMTGKIFYVVHGCACPRPYRIEDRLWTAPMTAEQRSRLTQSMFQASTPADPHAHGGSGAGACSTGFKLGHYRIRRPPVLMVT